MDNEIGYDRFSNLKSGIYDGENIDFSNIPKDLELELSNATELVRCSDGRVYLINNQSKRHILRPEILECKKLKNKKIQELSNLIIYRIPSGVPIYSEMDI